MYDYTYMRLYECFSIIFYFGWHLCWITTSNNCESNKWSRAQFAFHKFAAVQARRSGLQMFVGPSKVHCGGRPPLMDERRGAPENLKDIL